MFCSDESIKKYLISGVKYFKRSKYLDIQDATPLTMLCVNIFYENKKNFADEDLEIQKIRENPMALNAEM